MTEIGFGKASLRLDETGSLKQMEAGDGTMLQINDGISRPFLQIGLNKRIYGANKLEMSEGMLCFSFETGTSVMLAYQEKESYTVFRVERVQGDADALLVGPLYTALGEVIGDIVGVVQGTRWAIGIQALNAKTLGGFPEEFLDEAGELAQTKPISEISVGAVPYSSCTAFPVTSGGHKGSLLQLYCENRNRDRVKDIMNFKSVAVPPMKGKDAAIEGASFALFCCLKEECLDRIGLIELQEGLPHPMLDGVWAKKSRESMRSYLIADFKPDEFEYLLSCAKQCGFRNLYHAEPFENWGHFELRRECFPDGDATMAEYCSRAKQEGMNIGVHTLSAFTTTNDSYVTPVPDSRLAVLGGCLLSSAVGDADEEIFVGETACFDQVTSLQTIRIEQELIRYTEKKDGRLTGCQRGAWGTKAASHPGGAKAELLCDYPYRVFFPTLGLQEQYSKRLGDLFRETGIAQTSFDGLEGCAAAGEDIYGINRFCLDCWDLWQNPEVINDASGLHHNLWHMNTRMNWGEPWGAKMREGMIENRIKNQDFYRRNLFPRMLGWFLIRKADRKFEATSPEDIEWALSMASGFDAGFALSTSAKVLKMNGCSDELLNLIHDWEMLRMADKWSEEQRARLRLPETEWHLERGDGCFLLYPMTIAGPFVCDLLELQPGQPGGSDWTLDNPYGRQEYSLRLHVEGNGQIENPAFITKDGILRFSCTVKGGQYLWYRGKEAVITDRNYNIIGSAAVIGKGIAQPGRQAFSFSCDFSGEEGPEVTAKIFLYGTPETIR